MRALLVLPLAIGCAADEPVDERRIEHALAVCHDLATPIPIDEPRPEIGGRSANDLALEAQAAYAVFEADLVVRSEFAGSEASPELWPVSFRLAGWAPVAAAVLTSSDPEYCGAEAMMRLDVDLAVTGTVTSHVTGVVEATADGPVAFSAGGPLDGPLAEAAIGLNEDHYEDTYAGIVVPHDVEAGWGVSHRISPGVGPDFVVPSVRTSAMIGIEGSQLYNGGPGGGFSTVIAKCAAPDPCLYAPEVVLDEAPAR